MTLNKHSSAIQRASGILPSQALRQAIGQEMLTANPQIGEDQIQPASVDLRLGHIATRVRASFLPGTGARVVEKLEQHGLYSVDLDAGAILETNCIYVIPLLERCHLDYAICGIANPKSSTGRLDVFARVITDHGTGFDLIPAGYHGPLYVELAPHSFPVRVATGSRLTQIRLRQDSIARGDADLPQLQERDGLVTTDAIRAERIRDGGVAFTVDLVGSGDGQPVGYRARRGAGLVDVDAKASIDPHRFWEAVIPHAGGIVLEPNDFYILASKEMVQVPPGHAAEMLAYDTPAGEFRVHYAGFFDPGFGMGAADGQGSRAVLEVRARDVPFVLEDGQTVGRLIYEPLLEQPDKLYGPDIGSSYQRQGLRLARQFRQP